MVDRYHVDTDFLIWALASSGAERALLEELAGSEAILEISAIAWYEFCRGPRTPDQIGVARGLFTDLGILPFTDELAERAAGEFRRLGSPRRHAADIAIGVVAASRDATLLTRNARDFAGVEGLRVRTGRSSRRR